MGDVCAFARIVRTYLCRGNGSFMYVPVVAVTMQKAASRPMALFLSVCARRYICQAWRHDARVFAVCIAKIWKARFVLTRTTNGASM